MLGALQPEEEVVESEPSDDGEGLNNLLVDDVEDDRYQNEDHRDNQVEGTSMVAVEEARVDGGEVEVQIIASPPKF